MTMSPAAGARRAARDRRRLVRQPNRDRRCRCPTRGVFARRRPRPLRRLRVRALSACRRGTASRSGTTPLTRTIGAPNVSSRRGGRRTVRATAPRGRSSSGREATAERPRGRQPRGSGRCARSRDRGRARRARPSRCRSAAASASGRTTRGRARVGAGPRRRVGRGRVAEIAEVEARRHAERRRAARASVRSKAKSRRPCTTSAGALTCPSRCDRALARELADAVEARAAEQVVAELRDDGREPVGRISLRNPSTAPDFARFRGRARGRDRSTRSPGRSPRKDPSAAAARPPPPPSDVPKRPRAARRRRADLRARRTGRGRPGSPAARRRRSALPDSP